MDGVGAAQGQVEGVGLRAAGQHVVVSARDDGEAAVQFRRAVEGQRGGDHMRSVDAERLARRDVAVDRGEVVGAAAAQEQRLEIVEIVGAESVAVEEVARQGHRVAAAAGVERIAGVQALHRHGIGACAEQGVNERRAEEDPPRPMPSFSAVVSMFSAAPPETSPRMVSCVMPVEIVEDHVLDIGDLRELNVEVRERSEGAADLQRVVARAAVEAAGLGGRAEFDGVVARAAGDGEGAIGLRAAVEAERIRGAERGGVHAQARADGDVAVVGRDRVVVARIEFQRFDARHGRGEEGHPGGIVAVQLQRIAAGAAIDRVGRGQRAVDQEGVVAAAAMRGVVAAVIEVDLVGLAAAGDGVVARAGMDGEAAAGLGRAVEGQRIAGLQAAAVDGHARRHDGVVGEREVVAVLEEEDDLIDVLQHRAGDRKAGIVAVEVERVEARAAVDRVVAAEPRAHEEGVVEVRADGADGAVAAGVEEEAARRLAAVDREIVAGLQPRSLQRQGRRCRW